jgi:aspartate racemase
MSLGTIFTMKGEFFKKPFLDNRIEIITPNEQEMNLIDGKIATELEQNVVKEKTRESFIHIIERMKYEGSIQAVTLGCTELPLLLNDAVVPVPCLDTLRIHVQALINAMTEQ